MGGTDDNATIDQAQKLRHFEGSNEFDCVVTLYAWAAPANWGVEERRFGFPDANIIEEYIPTIVELAQWAHAKWAAGKKVNIRCQAGLNRSGLVTALTLMISGMSAQDAINTLREKRSDYALCNGEYERWLLNHAERMIEVNQTASLSA
jgi:protein-tyrosine phosphatase